MAIRDQRTRPNRAKGLSQTKTNSAVASSRTGGTQQRGREARATILEAAEFVFAQEGYGAASLDAIGHRAGMSKHRILHYFRSKKALYESVIAEVLSFVGEMIELYEQVDERDPSLAALELFVDQLAARPTLARLALFEMIGPESADSPRSISPFTEQIAASFEPAFKRLAPNAKPEEMLLFWSTIQGATLLYSASISGDTSRRTRAQREQNHERHRALVLSTARHLLKEIDANS